MWKSVLYEQFAAHSYAHIKNIRLKKLSLSFFDPLNIEDGQNLSITKEI